MKKMLIFGLLVFSFAPGVLAATIVSNYDTTLSQNQTHELAPVIITSTSDGDITAEHGIRILLDSEAAILWSEASLEITGTAKDNNKVNLNVQPEYSADGKVVYIPVMKDFEAGDWLSIQGLTVRSTGEPFDAKYLELDTSGDLVPEVHDYSSYRVVAGNGEVAELAGLLDYYTTRYSIKCKPSGVAVAENNSACLWARIDLIYAQSLTGEEKVAGLSLSDRDLELMAARRQWPEKRYEDNCITASQPASYCPALGKALDRISYFLD